MSNDAVTESWSAYWRTGNRASFFGGADAEARLLRVWDEFADTLADGARLLDLATGNGIVACRCAARARARRVRLRIDAVDAAKIDPARHVPDPEKLLSEVRFHAMTPLEALPFADASFDAVVSQFGFEYADETGARQEIARVLAPGGRLRLVMHARDGAVTPDIALRLERLRVALADDGPVTLVLALARAAEAGDARALQQASERLPAALGIMRHLAERPPPDDAALFYSKEFLTLWGRRERYWPADLRRSVEEGWANASGVALRQAEMLRVARSAGDVERIAEAFAAAGLTLQPVRELRDNARPRAGRGGRSVQIAWLLDATAGPA